MARFTRALRQQIVEEFSSRHDGQFIPSKFVEEVRARGPDHPAYNWFEWDAGKAAFSYQVEQARAFASDLRISFRVEEVGRRDKITVKVAEMPLVLSPVAGRSDGGGYYIADPKNPEHMAEYCRQAADALRVWLRRYDAAVAHVHLSSMPLEKVIYALDAAANVEIEKVAA